MKKLICMTLSLVMLLATATLAVSATTESTATLETPTTNDVPSATPTPTGTINDYLVSWWNFEGASAEEQLRDKGEFGKTRDDLTVNGNVTITDGVAHIPREANTALTAARAEDLYGIIDDMTVYVKAKYDGEVINWLDCVYYENLYRCYIRTWFAEYGESSLATSLLNLAHIRNEAEGATPPKNTWYYISSTMKIDRENLKLHGALHISFDGIKWTSLAVEKDLTAANLENAKKAQDSLKRADKAFAIGKSDQQKDCGAEYWIDEVRLFNKALTADELALIQPNTLDLREITDTPVVTDPVETDPVVTDPVVTDPVTPTTPAETKPATTPATTPATKAPSTTETPAGEQKTGCGAAVSATLVSLLAVFGGAVLAVKKKD